MRFAVLAFLCLAGVAQGNIFNDIWHTIEKPLEEIGDAGLGSVIKNDLLGKQDVSELVFHLLDEVFKWTSEAHELVTNEISELEKAASHIGEKFSDRTHSLLHDFQEAVHGDNLEKFIQTYSADIIKQFAAMLPKRLESKIWTHNYKISRKTRSKDILIKMLKNITIAHWFFTMPEMERQFLVAMLDAAEHGHLHEFVDDKSYDRVLLFIDHLPPAEGHKLNHYLIQHLNLENHHNTTTKPHIKPTRDVEEFLKMLTEIYSEHIYSLLDKDSRLFFLELMDAAEHERLTSFIADHSMEKVQELTSGIPKESGDKLTEFITERLKNESHAHHNNHHGHHTRDADILLTILKDIHAANIFFHLPLNERQFMLELMDAAEHDHLDAFVSKVTLQRVRDFVKHLPEDYAKAMTHYIQTHLHHHETAPTHPPLHNPAVFLTILKDIHTASIFMHLSHDHQALVLELMEAAENGHITSEVAKIGMPKLTDLANHLPSPFKEQFSTYVMQHLNMEKTTIPPHIAKRDLPTERFELHKMTAEHRRFYNHLKQAAENNLLKEFISKVGVSRLINFLDSLPDSMSETIQKLIVREMGEEDKVLNPINPKLLKRADHHHGHVNIHESIHHIGQHLVDNHSHYKDEHHKFYEDLKHAIEHHQLKEFIQHVGEDKLFEFLNTLPDSYAKSLEYHILSELEKEDHVHT